ncbi:MAG: fibronectin type III domain-containing protein [Bacteroidales bacterium]|jgi:hypothetical protein|nr:fibronectin type III domain-containing protein [Bacteroidales bacterium]
MKKIILLVQFSFLFLASYGQCVCDPPADVSATMHAPSWFDVKISWDYPECANVQESSISLAGTSLSTSIGFGETVPCDFYSMHRFLPSELADYDSMLLSGISFYPSLAGASYYLRVYSGGSYDAMNGFDPGQLLVEQDVTSLVVTGQLNTFSLNTPIVIDATEELWIGYRSVANAGYPAGAISGVSYSNRSEIIGYQDTIWETLTDSYLYYSWIIQGHIVAGISDMVGFDLYKDGSLLTSLANTTLSYTDHQVSVGTHTYGVKMNWSTPCTSTEATVNVDMPDDPCVVGITQLPYRDNFDGYTTSFPTCWHRFTTQAGTPSLSTAYSSSTLNSLYFNSTSTTYNMAVLPKVDDAIDLSETQLKFKLYKTSASYGLQIGIMSDTSDISTFELIERISPSTTGTWEDFTVYFNEYDGTGKFVTFLSLGSSNSIYLDDVELDYYPDCIEPSHLELVSINGFSAMITWQPPAINQPDDYVVEISDDNGQTWIVANTQNTFYLFSSLDEVTTYLVRVASSCDEGNSAYIHMSMRTKCLNGGEVEIGGGTGTSYLYPVNNYYNYTLSQQIYLASEMSGATAIEGISFEYAYSYPSTLKNNVDIYIGHTTKTSFSDDSDWDTASLTLVYSGNLNCSQGWNDFAFTTPFLYNGIDNVLLVVDDNSADYDGLNYVFATHSTTGNKTLVAYSDGTNPVYGVYPPGGDYDVMPNRVNTKWIAECGEEVICYPPGLYVLNVTSASADIYWALAGGIAGYEIEYRSMLENDWTEITPTDDNYHLDGLNGNTQYQVRIRALCSGDESAWITVVFRTACSAELGIPYFENFESNGANSPTYPMPLCWARGGNADPYPYQSTNYRLSGSASLYFASSSTTYSMALLPAISNDVNIQDLRMTFNLYKIGNSNNLMIGVMTDPADESTFQLVRTLSPLTTSTWEEFTVYFTNYTDTGKYIVFKSDLRSSSLSNYMYMDDLLIEFMPDCSNPVNLEASYIGGTSALLSWQDGQLGQTREYVIEIYDEYAEDWVGVDVISDTWYVLENLTDTTVYTYRVKAVCDTEDGESESTYSTVSFETGCTSGGTIEIGTGTATSILLPLNNYYNYTLSQQIYLATEMGGPTSISAIAFDYNHTSPSTNKTDVDIYLGHTTKNNFSGSNDWESDTAFHKYYSGPLNCSKGWNVFMLDSAFTYNGIDNLIIMVDDNSNDYNNSSCVFNVNSVSSNLSIYYCNDNTNPSVSTPPDASSYSSMLRNNIRFIAPCDDTYTCAPTNVMAYNVTHNSADIAWSAPENESSWIVEYKAEGDTVWTSLGTLTTTTHSFTQLDMNTTYYVRVFTDCGSELSAPVVISFTTECGYLVTLPYSDDFDSYGTGSSVFPACWIRKSTYGTYPYISASYPASSPASYYFYCSSSTYSLSSVYALDDALTMSDVSVEFSIYASSARTAIYVGVMSDPLDETTFELIEKIDLPYAIRMNYHIPFNAYTGTGKYITFKADGSAQGYTQAFYMDNLVIDVAPVCARPLNISVSDITLTDCNVRWDAAAGEEYEVVIGPVGFDPDSATNGYTTTDTFYVFTNELTAETQYDVYVRTICGSGNESDWSFATTFWSACQDITYGDLPYTESFDTWGTGSSILSFPNCWGRVSSYAPNYPYISSNNTMSTPGALYFYSNTYYYTIGILPMIDPNLPLDTLELKFNVYASYNDNGSGIEVGVMTDPADHSTFTSVGQIIVPTAGVWNEADFDFSLYTGTGRYIALRCIGSDDYVYVDDVKLDILPSCRKPADLEYTSVTTTDVTLSWIERGDATTWEIEYGAPGFTPGDGSGTSVIANSNPYTVQGLTIATHYDFYVRSICAVGDTSDWSSPALTIVTRCNSITTFPYTEDFENNGAWPTCWTQEYVIGRTNWVFQDGGYASNPSGAQSGSYNALFQYVGRGASSRLISPVFDFTGYENAYITFWHAHLAWSGDQDVLEVYYQTTTSSNWTLLATHSSSVSWTYDSLALPNVGNGTRICFVGTSDYGYGVCIDNIKINATLQEIEEPCLAPHTLTVPTATITANSAVINWQTSGTETSWMVEYKKGSDSYTSTMVTSTTHMLQSLQPLTLYDVRVKALCGTEESQYISTSFTTLPDSVEHYTVTVVCGSNGSISPAGPSIDVIQGSDLEFLVTPNSGYKILQVKIDDENVDVGDSVSYSYTFSDIRSNHSIEAHFTYTSIDDYEKGNDVLLYPNPANSLLNVVLFSPFDQVEITNIMGQTIFMNSVNDLTFTLNVSDYNAGVYFIRLSGANGVVTKKFVKK